MSVEEFLSNTSMNACGMTHWVSELGGNDMLRGFQTFYDDAIEAGKEIGWRIGFSKGYASGERDGKAGKWVLAGISVVGGLAVGAGLAHLSAKHKSAQQTEEDVSTASEDEENNESVESAE